jgi:hypothetical protein
MAEPDVARFEALLTSRVASFLIGSPPRGSVTNLNKMQRDSQAHRMPQAPLSRSPRDGLGDERRVSSGTGTASAPAWTAGCRRELGLCR